MDIFWTLMSGLGFLTLSFVAFTALLLLASKKLSKRLEKKKQDETDEWARQGGFWETYNNDREG